MDWDKSRRGVRPGYGVPSLCVHVSGRRAKRIDRCRQAASPSPFARRCDQFTFTQDHAILGQYSRVTLGSLGTAAFLPTRPWRDRKRMVMNMTQSTLPFPHPSQNHNRVQANMCAHPRGRLNYTLGTSHDPIVCHASKMSPASLQHSPEPLPLHSRQG